MYVRHISIYCLVSFCSILYDMVSHYLRRFRWRALSLRHGSFALPGPGKGDGSSRMPSFQR